MALRDLKPANPCPRCGKPLIPDEYKDANGDYRIPRGWLKNLHLDHRDGTDTAYHGLAHASCNVRAPHENRKKKP